MPAFLVLEDGTVYRGRPYAAHGIAVGELVFTTSMTGYQEVVTDPSFFGPAHHLHPADDRKLRRRARRRRSRTARMPVP